jgi:RNA-binding protein
MNAIPKSATDREAQRPSGKDLRDLLARAHRLKARTHLAGPEVKEAQLVELRAAFEKSDLLKVRIDVEDRDTADRTAGELARRVPCVLLRRVGRVAVLYRAPGRLKKDTPTRSK